MKQELVLITGMSGSGKSVALHALEDAGYYCVDNLPPDLLMPFMQLEGQQQPQKVAIAMDVRSANALPQVPQQLAQLRLGCFPKLSGRHLLVHGVVPPAPRGLYSPVFFTFCQAGLRNRLPSPVSGPQEPSFEAPSISAQAS